MKLSKETKVFLKKNTPIFVIAVSGIICLSCVFSDIMGEVATEDIISNTPVENIVSDTNQMKKNADKTLREIGADKFISELQEEIENEQNTEEAVSESTMSESFPKNSAETDLLTLQEALVVRVIDGDTFVLDIENTETKVRLIGVDTPESVAPESYYTDNTQEGKTVSDIVRDKLQKGDLLYLEYDVSKTDKYGRTLAYVYFSDGIMVQEWLLNEGLANVATYPPNVKYADRFAELAHKAAESKTGLWSGFFEE